MPLVQKILNIYHSRYTLMATWCVGFELPQLYSSLNFIKFRIWLDKYLHTMLVYKMIFLVTSFSPKSHDPSYEWGLSYQITCGCAFLFQLLPIPPILKITKNKTWANLPYATELLKIPSSYAWHMSKMLRKQQHNYGSDWINNNMVVWQITVAM